MAEFTLEADESAWFVLEMVTGTEPSGCENPEYAQDRSRRPSSSGKAGSPSSIGPLAGDGEPFRARLEADDVGAHGACGLAHFGLPETVGGVRNWDYRYCWIRDSSSPLRMMRTWLSPREADSFMRWCRRGSTRPEGGGK